MSNMSYCRFENTARDLFDCIVSLSYDGEGLDGLSESERFYAYKMYRRCQDYINDYIMVLQDSSKQTEEEQQILKELED